MNIFAVDENPVLAARDLCDKHIVKMTVETAQLLSTALYLTGIYHKNLYKPTHIHHPCVSWVVESEANLCWLIDHGLELGSEYSFRYRKIHKSHSVICEVHKLVFKTKTLLQPPSFHTPFVQCMPEQYRGPDAIEAYRRFYRGEKVKFAKWRYTQVPQWWHS